MVEEEGICVKWCDGSRILRLFEDWSGICNWRLCTAAGHWMCSGVHFWNRLYLILLAAAYVVVWGSLRCGGLSASCYLVAQLSSSTEEVAHKYASKDDTQSLLKFWPKYFNLWKYCRSSTPPVLLINSGCSPWKVIPDEHYQAVDNKREDEDYQWTIRENNSPIFHAPPEPPSVAGWVDLINWRKRKSK